MNKKIGDFIGYSDIDIHKAIENALTQAGEHSHYEIVESQCSHNHEQNRSYQVTLTAFSK